MRTTRRRVAVLAIAVAAGLTVWLSLGNAATSRPRTNSGKAGPTCRLAQPQPAEPLELTSVPLTIRTTDYVKSIAMEKEVFACEPSSVKDVETFIERVEARQGARMVLVNTRVEQVACLKLFPKGVILCKAQPVKVDAPTSALEGCQPLAQTLQPAAPVRLNSVAVGGLLVKSVKVEKEVWTCRNGSVLADIYLFTEIVEYGPKLFFPISNTVDGIVCFKSQSAGQLIGCSQLKIGTLQ